MNRIHTHKSDIEEILQSQTWKHKKLEPINLASKASKSSKTSNKQPTAIKETPSERKITQKCLTALDSPFQSPLAFSSPASTTPDCKPNLMSLAVPYSILNKAISEVSLGSSRLGFQVPVFPKRKFGKSTECLPGVPKFKSLKSLCCDNEIIELKLENGRIRKNHWKTGRKRFEFLDDFNQITNDKVIERMKSNFRVID